MPEGGAGEQHVSDRHDDADDSTSQRLMLTRTLSGGVSITESVAYQEGIPQETIPDDGKAALRARSISWIPVKYLLLLCGFLTSMSFGVTQVPLLYVFRLMTCDDYYKSHPNQTADVSFIGASTRSELLSVYENLSPLYLSGIANSQEDRCSLRAIETSTALSISLLGASTTVFGIVNLFLTGSLIKRIGVQRALVIQVFFPAIRLLIQNVGVEVWGYTGILIVQCSQIASIIGGPSGYILALNQFITDVVNSEQRTVALGRLAGTMLFGSAFGFLIGGVLADAFGIKVPFRLTLTLFLCSTAFVVLFLPYTPPTTTTSDEGSTTTQSESTEEPNKHNLRTKNRFFGPLLVFLPRKFILKNGQVQTEYGALLLACGVFLGIVATGYLPTLLQLYSTDIFKFGTKQNGWLIFIYSMLRGVFLTFAFPQLITLGRKYMTRSRLSMKKSGSGQDDMLDNREQQPLLDGQRTGSEVANSNQPTKEIYTFDLTYTRFSIVADGVLTLLCTFLREGWQMYLVAAILPFAAGTGSAAKGTVLQIVGNTAMSDERTDALAGISLVENMARLTTVFAFGVVFAAFTNLGRPELVFTVNAACALVAFAVLLFARFPPEGSVPLDTGDKVAVESSEQ